MNYFIISFMIIVTFAAGIICLASVIRLVRRQIKLINSIMLVELKSGKWHYMVFFAFGFVAFLVTVFALVGIFDSEFITLYKAFAMPAWQVQLILSFLLFLIVAVEFLFIVLYFAKSAVVDKGIYTALNYLDWYHVHDYIIDEHKGVVILSTSKDTFNTIRGTTTPLRVTKEDIPKLKFILNKNKNKFSA